MRKLQRLESIDLMRGLVMMLMALDHTRDFFSNFMFEPTNLSQTTPGLFLTRWITHLCAPTFVFLTGVSAFLSTHRRNLTYKGLALYLISRGLWLVILELTLVRFGWLFNWNYQVSFGQVIWALGCSMIGLAFTSYLPRWLIGGLGLTLIAGHNLFDSYQPNDFSWLWTILHKPGKLEIAPGYNFYLVYPLIPWLGAMMSGYAFGPVFLKPVHFRKRLLPILGILLLLLFIGLRLTNLYGDPRPWQPQQNWLFSLFSILNCTKYPPSLLYLLMTLSMLMFLLRGFESARRIPLKKSLLLFGQVPLFFYLLHLPLIHGTALWVTWLRGLPVDWLVGRGNHGFPSPPAPEFGFSLPAVYIIWLIMLVILYPLCASFANYKQHHPHLRWLSYL